MLCHTIDLGLQILSSKGPLPVIFQRQALAQILFDFVFQLRLTHHCIQGWLGIAALLWPNAMTPVNFFNRTLVGYTFSKRECSWRSLRRQFRAKERQG